MSGSLVEGIALVDQIGWDAFNESQDIVGQTEKYKQRYGHYPKSVLADGIYGTRINRSFMKKNGVRFGGKALDRPAKVTAENKERLKQQKAQRKRDALDRIPIEGKFGQGKNGYRLNYIRARLRKTSEAWINSIFLVMNVMVLLRELYDELINTGRNKFFVVSQTCLTQMISVLLSIFKLPRIIVRFC